MAGFSFGPLTRLEALALSDIEQALDRYLAAVGKMMSMAT